MAVDLSSAKQLVYHQLQMQKEALVASSPGITNLFLLPGEDTPESLISSISNGFYVTDMIGSSVSMVTGDYSRGASGFWIKNGELSTPLQKQL